MIGSIRKYNRQYKEQAIKLAEEKGCKDASIELGISYNTLYGWIRRGAKDDHLIDDSTTENVADLDSDLQQLRRTNKELTKEIQRLQEENDFLAEAIAFFAASRLKSSKKE